MDRWIRGHTALVGDTAAFARYQESLMPFLRRKQGSAARFASSVVPKTVSVLGSAKRGDRAATDSSGCRALQQPKTAPGSAEAYVLHCSNHDHASGLIRTRTPSGPDVLIDMEHVIRIESTLQRHKP